MKSTPTIDQIRDRLIKQGWVEKAEGELCLPFFSNNIYSVVEAEEIQTIFDYLRNIPKDLYSH